MCMNSSKLLFTAILTAFTAQLEAITITGGSDLLDTAGGSQLETWLGEGSLTLTKIFTHSATFDTRGNVIWEDGKTATDFHAAADGKGRTITLYKTAAIPNLHDNQTGQIIYDLFPEMIIGGYNPQSWQSLNPSVEEAYHLTPDLSDRTGAIFNLTSSLLFPQRSDNRGQYQTANDWYLGPSFGGGYDIGLYSMNTAYMQPFSYTPGAQGLGQNVLGFNGSIIPNILEFEVFTISSAAAVPDGGAPLGLLMLGFSLTLMIKYAPNRIEAPPLLSALRLVGSWSGLL
jgi:hypothetical protein